MQKSVVNLCVLPIIWSWLICLSIVLYLLSHLPRFFSGRYYHFLTRYWCRVFIRALDVDLKLVHKNKNPLPEHYILIANHPSALEDFGVPALFDIYPLAKEAVRKWIILGRISDYAGTIYVKREDVNSRHAAKQSLVNAVKAGKNLVIFPEGGCKGRKIHTEFHRGAFDISIKTGVPVLPVFLQYMDQDTFEWTHESLIKKLWQIFKTDNNHVNYYVFDAIFPKDFDDSENFSSHVHSLYMQWQKEYLDPL